MSRGVLGMLTALAACSVTEKEPVSGDAGHDARTPAEDAGAGSDPETTIEEAPPAFSATPTATFVFRSDVDDATFACSVDGGQPAPCTSPLVLTLDDGPHHFAVGAIRSAIERDGTPAEHVWTIDTVAPSTMLASAPPPVDPQSIATFVFTSDEASATFDCALDSEAFAPCQSGLSLGPLGDGAHAFAVRARDRAGNIDPSPVIHVWVIDTSAPDTLLISGPSGTTSERTATFSFLSPDAGSGASFECALDDSAFDDCTSPHAVAELAEGTHTFAVRARDAAGNVDPTPAVWMWSVDLASTPRSASGPSASPTQTGSSTSFATPRSLDRGPS